MSSGAHAGREEVHLNVVAIQVVMWKINIADVMVKRTSLEYPILAQEENIKEEAHTIIH